MSFITGKPFVDSILGGLKESEVLRLQTLINSSSPELQGSYRTYPLGSLPADSLENIITVIHTGNFKYVSISYDPVVRDYHKGILCRLGGGNFSFLGWEPGTKVMSAVKLTQNNFSPVNEQLTTEEFRRVLSDLVIESGEVGDFVKIEEVTNLPLEGEEDTIYLSDTNVIADGVVELPVPEVSDEGKVLKVGSNGGYQLDTDNEGIHLYLLQLGMGEHHPVVTLYILLTERLEGEYSLYTSMSDLEWFGLVEDIRTKRANIPYIIGDNSISCDSLGFDTVHHVCYAREYQVRFSTEQQTPSDLYVNEVVVKDSSTDYKIVALSITEL